MGEKSDADGFRSLDSEFAKLNNVNTRPERKARERKTPTDGCMATLRKASRELVIICRRTASKCVSFYTEERGIPVSECPGS